LLNELSEEFAIYSYSQKFSWDGIALLDKPAVAPRSQSVITFENGYGLPLENFRAGRLESQPHNTECSPRNSH
jgi:hypothetical protein